MRSRVSVFAIAGMLVLAAGAVTAGRGALRLAGESVGDADVRGTPGLRPDEHLLFNGWGLTPVGEHVGVADMPMKLVFSPDGRMLAASCGGFRDQGVSLIDLKTRQVLQTLKPLRAWNGVAFDRDGKRLLAAGGNSGMLFSWPIEEGKAGPEKSTLANPEATTPFLSGLAVHPVTGAVYVCDEANGEVWALNPETLKREASAPAGSHPHTCVFGADRRHLYVSDWGGRSVSVIDTNTMKRVREIGVGVRPNDMALAPDGRIFVACSGDNTVHVIQTRALETAQPEADPTRRIPEGVREILSTSLYPASPEGSTPDGVAVSPDGKRLYVANADNNDVMVADISAAATTRVLGFVPVGWYPTAAAVSPGGTLIVANGKGLRSRPNQPPQLPGPVKLFKPPPFDYIGKTLEGAISFIKQPSAEDLEELTEQVRRNSPYTPESVRQASAKNESVIPSRVGDPCPIRHVLYIIKENRTYDQVFGDFRDAKGRRAGNGDPSLVMFGEKVAPNHHRLAREYVLLDNLYCNGEVSVDGHSWCDAAIATDFNERKWIMSYSGHGAIPGNDEMDTPLAGYLWDLCRRNGVSFKCYGEGSGRVPTANRGTWPSGRDKDRVGGWIEDLHRAESSGDLPKFAIMSLGEDHTQGTTPGKPTPEAAVASNDIAIGRIVQAASKSRFWKEMAIFAIEDDAQNGPDHVDSHRTMGLVVGPHVKRGYVDSTLYSTASMIRTMELILGLPPLTQYDAGATPMFNSFARRARLEAFRPEAPQVDVNALNTIASPGAKQSMRMDFDEYDRAPEDPLNRILWRAVKGASVPYPVPRHGLVAVR